jgi:hypothetical protein
MTELLAAEYLADARRRAYRYQGQWTGTAGSLAADVARLLNDREVLVGMLAGMKMENSTLRQLVEKPAAEADESISIPPPAAEAACDVESDWAGVRGRHQEMHRRIREAGKAFRVIGISGRAGSGKTTVAGMIPGAVVVQLADPLYAALAAMLGLPESMLRSPHYKEKPVPGLGKSPRQMLQTLGTEWGRELVDRHVWIRLLERRIAALREAGVETVAVADIRFENEAAAIRAMPGGEVWRVHRLGPATASGHSSEAGVVLREHEVEIQNYGNLDALRTRVLEALAVPC